MNLGRTLRRPDRRHLCRPWLLAGNGVDTRKKLPSAASQGLTADEHRISELGISPCELEILGLIAAGLSNREIADRLFVSENTTMVLPGLLVFFGIRAYPENIFGGTLTFARGVALGILITLVSTSFTAGAKSYVL